MENGRLTLAAFPGQRTAGWKVTLTTDIGSEFAWFLRGVFLLAAVLFLNDRWSVSVIVVVGRKNKEKPKVLPWSSIVVR